MRKILQKTILIAGILLILVGSSNANNAMFLIGPYSQNSHFDSILISWNTVTPTTLNEVHWGRSPTLGNVTAEKSIFAKTAHTVEIEELSAGQKYYYTIVSDQTESPLYTFWTAFPPNQTIRFVAYGDSQGNWDNWRTVSLVSQAIEKTHPAFVLKTGDQVDNGKNLDNWIDFFTASSYLHNSTLYPVLGNHEYYSHLYFSFFSLPCNERWYSFENGPVHFIGLSSSERDRYRLIQSLWLFNDLRSNNESFTIVFFHHPVYSSGEHGNTTLLQKIWAPMFERFHVNIVFNGHDHDYERSIVNGVTYIVIGGGGSPLYNIGHSPWTVYSEKTYHYCLLTANSSLLTFEAIKPDGAIFDSFMIPK
jgi:hypothetical protein